MLMTRFWPEVRNLSASILQGTQKATKLLACIANSHMLVQLLQYPSHRYADRIACEAKRWCSNSEQAYQSDVRTANHTSMHDSDFPLIQSVLSKYHVNISWVSVLLQRTATAQTAPPRLPSMQPESFRPWTLPTPIDQALAQPHVQGMDMCSTYLLRLIALVRQAIANSANRRVTKEPALLHPLVVSLLHASVSVLAEQQPSSVKHDSLLAFACSVLLLQPTAIEFVAAWTHDRLASGDEYVRCSALVESVHLSALRSIENTKTKDEHKIAHALAIMAVVERCQARSGLQPSSTAMVHWLEVIMVCYKFVKVRLQPGASHRATVDSFRAIAESAAYTAREQFRSMPHLQALRREMETVAKQQQQTQQQQRGENK
jgi:hypothetical protein